MTKDNFANCLGCGTCDCCLGRFQRPRPSRRCIIVTLTLQPWGAATFNLPSSTSPWTLAISVVVVARFFFWSLLWPKKLRQFPLNWSHPTSETSMLQFAVSIVDNCSSQTASFSHSRQLALCLIAAFNKAQGLLGSITPTRHRHCRHWSSAHLSSGTVASKERQSLHDCLYSSLEIGTEKKKFQLFFNDFCMLVVSMCNSQFSHCCGHKSCSGSLWINHVFSTCCRCVGAHQNQILRTWPSSMLMMMERLGRSFQTASFSHIHHFVK